MKKKREEDPSVPDRASDDNAELDEIYSRIGVIVDRSARVEARVRAIEHRKQCVPASIQEAAPDPEPRSAAPVPTQFAPSAHAHQEVTFAQLYAMIQSIQNEVASLAGMQREMRAEIAALQKR
jgi:hypothetical protein